MTDAAVATLLAEGARALTGTADNARLEAQLLLAQVLAVSRAQLHADPEATADAAQAALYRGLLLEGCAEEWIFQERQAEFVTDALRARYRKALLRALIAAFPCVDQARLRLLVAQHDASLLHSHGDNRAAYLRCARVQVVAVEAREAAYADPRCQGVERSVGAAVGVGDYRFRA